MIIPSVPIVPPPPPPVIFPGVRERRSTNELGESLNRLLVKLARIAVVPDWTEMMYRYKSIIHPGSVVSPARLPYPAAGSPNCREQQGSKQSMAVSCLYAHLSWTILSYWNLCLHGEGTEETVRRYITELEELIDHTERGNQLNLIQILARCDVEGDVRQGYWLQWRGTL